MENVCLMHHHGRQFYRWLILVNFCEDFHKGFCIFVEFRPLTPPNSSECVIKVDMGFKGEIIELWVFLWVFV